MEDVMPGFAGIDIGGFYLGTHVLGHCSVIPKPCVSVRVLRGRRKGFRVGEWLMDSGAFTELNLYGQYRTSVAQYAEEINRWYSCGRMVAAVAQDYMCEPFVLSRTGLDVPTHQRLTIERYDALVGLSPRGYVMPVLQGYEPVEYQRHVRQYGGRLLSNQWVGVGSVCKRNGDPTSVWKVLRAVHAERPDLNLHGFGLKITSLGDTRVRRRLYSADSMAWSRNARYNGQDANGIKEAMAYYERVKALLV